MGSLFKYIFLCIENRNLVLFHLTKHKYKSAHINPFWKVSYSEPVFLNVYGDQESIPRNEIRQPM